MAIDDEKILTMSATEYCNSRLKMLKEYDLFGVSCVGILHFKDLKSSDFPRSNLAAKVPENAEVVVQYQSKFAPIVNSYNFSSESGNAFYEATGIALIPRKDESS